ncbi:putative FimV domain protein [Acinetobacter lwoffii SH145]|nr:putative FimV domain protein [Acinetobacter lwoffii SH145]
MLLDIHILQKDDFAITQLINHIRALNIDDVLSPAEEKRTAYEKTKATESTQTATPATPVSNNTAFDALNQATLPADTKTELAFEQLQQEIAPAKEEPSPLEFNFTPSSAPAAPVTTKTEPVENKSLDFNTAPSIPQAEPTETPAKNSNEIQFDFDSFKVETTTTEVSPSAARDTLEPNFEKKISGNEIADFDLKLESNHPQTAAATEEIKPLDFSFSLDTPVPAAEKTAVPATEFDLSSLTAAAPVAEPASQTNLSGMDFKLDHLETTPEAPAATAMSFDLPATPAQATIDQHDPLVQSFPELLDVNEAGLNLDLAQQYIQLGAYAAAREVIAEREAEYTPEQQQRAEQLLNQIAS